MSILSNTSAEGFSHSLLTRIASGEFKGKLLKTFAEKQWVGEGACITLDPHYRYQSSINRRVWEFGLINDYQTKPHFTCQYTSFWPRRIYKVTWYPDVYICSPVYSILEGITAVPCSFLTRSLLLGDHGHFDICALGYVSVKCK